MAGQLLVSQPNGCEARLRGRTAIPAEFAEQGRAREVTDLAPDEVVVTPGRAVALVALAGLVLALAVLPALVGLRIVPAASGSAAVGVGLLVAVVGGVKLAAVGWGLAARFVAARPLRIGATAVD